MRRLRGLDPLFAGEFGPPIDIDRRGFVVLTIGLALAAVEHIVRRIVDQCGVLQRRFFGKDTWGVAVDFQGKLRIRFRLVHRGISGGVDDQARTHTANSSDDRISRSKIENIARRRDDFAEDSERTAQFPTYLSGTACDEDSHDLVMGDGRRVRGDG